jgi:CDP-diacylglycerol--glycerol-3-phosphate 3-phosphatidyltransferase
MKHLPNLMTGARLVLALFVFLALASVGGAAPWLSARLTDDGRLALERWAFFAYVAAAVTDFFDGWLARRLRATSVWGAILDPIADKVLVCAAVLGLMTLPAASAVAIPAGLILFREFAVSALREVTAGKGVTLPVTLLAKWKTTFQLVALGAELIVAGWRAFGLPDDAAVRDAAALAAHSLLWFAAIVTLITGAQYVAQARRTLADDRDS